MAAPTPEVSGATRVFSIPLMSKGDIDVKDPGGNNLVSTEGVAAWLLQGAFRGQWPTPCQETQRRSGRAEAAECRDYFRLGPK